LVFLTFVGIHLFNTLLASAGPDACEHFQTLSRAFYQHALVEPILMRALVVHASAGVIRLRNASPPASFRRRLHRWTGVFLLVFVFGHIAAVRGPSVLLGVYPGFEGISLSVAFAPAWFYPYYLLLLRVVRNPEKLAHVQP
jgi:hypothetical protein